MRELSNDELVQLSNDDLRQLFLKMRSKINYSKRNKSQCMKDEVYYCYISKEINNRNSFKK